LAFSDEVGRSKPEPVMFETTAAALGVKLTEIVHIGDREQKDVQGARAVGARAVLSTVVKDRGVDSTKAEAVCSDYKKLAAIIEDLNK
jgi:putative hydrolase of the HAD superfamily